MPVVHEWPGPVGGTSRVTYPGHARHPTPLIHTAFVPGHASKAGDSYHHVQSLFDCRMPEPRPVREQMPGLQAPSGTGASPTRQPLRHLRAQEVPPAGARKRSTLRLHRRLRQARGNVRSTQHHRRPLAIRAQAIDRNGFGSERSEMVARHLQAMPRRQDGANQRRWFQTSATSLSCCFMARTEASDNASNHAITSWFA